jgi:hypothetical protein
MGQNIFIRSIKGHHWSGFHRYPKCKDTVIAALSKGGYATGLTTEEEKDLEQKLRLAEGELSRYSEYWENYSVILTDKELQLDLDNPKDFMDYKILMESKRVANSITERHMWPKAEYVIYDAEEDAVKDNLAVKAKRKAYKKFNSFSSTKMKEVLKLLGRNADNSSETLVENALSEIIESDPNKFNEITEMKDFKTRVLLQTLIDENIVRRRKGNHYYGDVQLGFDQDAAIAFLDNPENQEMLMVLKQKLKAHDVVNDS